MIKIFILSAFLGLILFKSKNEHWFNTLNKPNINLNVILILYLLSFYFLYKVWEYNQHLTSYIVLSIILTLLWSLYFFSVCNFRLPLIILVLILFNAIFAITNGNLQNKQYMIAYVTIFAIIFFYNLKIYILNV
jgi:membrane-anchored glycerophosphoryl diester phosphodiesterase (GDPDase)